MTQSPLNLADLSPRDAKFKLSDFPDKEFTLSRWSLRVRAWVADKYSQKQLQEIFENKNITAASVIVYYMLKEKDSFINEKGMATLEAFQDRIVTIQDQINMMKALLEAIGIGEPEIKKISDSLPKEEKEVEPDPNV